MYCFADGGATPECALPRIPVSSSLMSVGPEDEFCLADASYVEFATIPELIRSELVVLTVSRGIKTLGNAPPLLNKLLFRFYVKCVYKFHYFYPAPLVTTCFPCVFSFMVWVVKMLTNLRRIGFIPCLQVRVQHGL